MATALARPDRRRSILPAALFSLWLLGAAAALVAGFLWEEKPWEVLPQPPAPPPAQWPPQYDYNMRGGVPLDLPGIDRPAAVSPAQANLPDDAPVIGVQAGGRCRAYVIQALSQGPRSHIINDVLGGAPVTVTYCQITHCIQAFTGTGTEPLAVRQGGLFGNGMVLRADGWAYSQRTLKAQEEEAPDFPYPAYPSQKVTWGEWRKAHPDTDVYLGPPEGKSVGG